MTDHREDLKRIGLKNTKHRAAILEIFEKRTQPVSAEQIFGELSQRGIAICLSTVYRELDSLVSNGLVTKIKINENNRALYEYSQMTHRHYLVCLGCKEMIPIDVCPLEAFERDLEKQTHFKITDHKLNLYGYCPKCQAKDLADKE